ncbi:hypothetical protein CRG98_028011 [Punica granatum]|uniref:Uncharacterized protein n=1 Tax=Punica granatum TaxID=22663 RepID=A0A2I0J5T4_PUNGR|nr:hypothetical protein CRG98_028011 [Punica granatum]
MRRSGSISDHGRVDKQDHQDRPVDHQGGCRVWDCGSPLYDSYELAAVNHLLERHMMILPPSCGSRRIVPVMPSGRIGPVGSGRKGEAEASIFLSATTSLARSLGRRLSKIVPRRRIDKRYHDDNNNTKVNNANGKVVGFRFNALSCGAGRGRFGDR